MTAIVLALTLQTTCATPGSEYSTYAEAYQEASETSKPLLVMVTATWCGPCQNMKATVLPEVRRRGILNEFSFGVVDVDRERTLVQQLGGTGPIPQLVCYRQGKGQWYRSKLIGNRGVDQIEKFLRNVVSKHDIGSAKSTKKALAHQVGRTDKGSKTRITPNIQETSGLDAVAKK